MIIVMGPGRCGTTFWLRLFQDLGVDTGGCHEIFREKPREIQNPDFQWPRVIKGTGTLCAGLNKWVENRGWEVEHVYLCVREIEANIKSMTKRKKGSREYKGLAPETLYAKIRDEILGGYGQALNQIVSAEYPFTIVKFPKSAQEIGYAYDKFREGPIQVSYKDFRDAWESVLDRRLLRFGG